MSERETAGDKPRAIQFGDQLPQAGHRRRQRPAEMFPDGDDLPIFSGTPQSFVERPFVPLGSDYKQQMLPDMPDVDWDAVLEADRRLRGKQRQGTVSIEQEGTIWRGTEEESAALPSEIDRAAQLREILTRYHLDIPRLRELIARGEDISGALRTRAVPDELRHLLEVFAAVLRPAPAEQIRSPADAVALLMTEMAHLDQEQFRVLCLDTKNRLQKMHLVYQGSLNSASIRIAEVYKEPIRLNSAAVIVTHNHPSGEPTPSPEDILVTRQIVEAGKLLDIDCLDHLVIGQGRWVSMRERGLGFDSR